MNGTDCSLIVMTMFMALACLASPAAALTDCGADFDCFIEASEGCRPASLTSTGTIDIFGVEQTTTNYFEIKGEAGGKCYLYVRTESIEVEFSDGLVQAMLDAGATAEEIEEHLQYSNEIADALEGSERTCKFNQDDLTDMLNRWKEGNTSAGVSCRLVGGEWECTETGDLAAGECEEGCISPPTTAQLSVWGSEEVTYVFEPVDFYADYSRPVYNIPIEGACRLSHNLGEDWLDMEYNPESGLHQVSEEFIHPGFYQYQVECSHPGFETIRLTDEFIVYSPPGRVCGVDVYGLDVQGNEITVQLQNTGNWKELVEYTLYVDGEEVSAEERVMEEGETLYIEVEHDFEPSYTGHEVRIEASAACGARDQEGMAHWKQVPYTCSNPPGVEGQNRCNPGNQEVLVCRNGEWVESSLDYSYSCPSPHEVGYRCSTGWTGDTRCTEDGLQKEYRNRDCTTKWATVGECTVCGVEIGSLDFEDRILDAREGKATLVIENTGYKREEVNLMVYIDGKRDSSTEFWLDSGEEKTKTVYYSADSGTHNLEFRARAGCGWSDSRHVELEVYKMVRMSLIEPEPQPEYLETGVGFSPDSLDMVLGKSGVVRVSIQTSEPQVFTLDVKGVPEDWASYTREMRVDRTRTAYVYLTPKEMGSYTLELEAMALDDGEEFSSQVELYVAEPQEAEDEFSQFNQEVRAVAAELFAQPQTLYLIITAFFVIVLLAGFARLREPSIWDKE